jgi:hypothetical protein
MSIELAIDVLDSKPQTNKSETPKFVVNGNVDQMRRYAIFKSICGIIQLRLHHT